MNPRGRETLAELLLAWEDAFQSGHDVPAAELACDHPDLIEPLERRIRVLKATSWIDHPQDRSGDDDVETPSSGGRMLGGRYRLDGRIAVGGFAEVWRGFDTDLQRTVAVKIPKPSRIAMRDAFLAEARRVARLRHPSITSVHDVGIDGDECFIVSEFMDGGSLSDRLARGPIDRSQAIRWVAQIAEALDFAHREGVIHRDVKPANILLNHHGDAMLADFGIAQSATKTGSFAPSLGTLRYMAPEQLEGKPVGPTADVYSLGIVLHEVLTGSTPHSTDAPPAIHREVISGRELTIAGSLPRPLAAICRRAINRDATQRYPTAADFAAELRGDARATAPPKIARRHALAVTAFLLAAAAGITLVARRPIPKSPRSASPAPTALIPAAKAPPNLSAASGTRTASRLFLRIEESLPYIIEVNDVGHYLEWQDFPATYLGPMRNDVECFVTYRFDAASPIEEARLIAASRCWDFTKASGGMGRGAAAIDVSRDGVTWLTLRDTIADRAWGTDWSVDELLPEAVVGGRSLWIRARLLTNSSPNAAYSVAQFGRNRDAPSQPAFGIVAELAPMGAQRVGRR